MRIDLHAHSDVSDGSEPPGKVMSEAVKSGLDVVALTDHDSTGGWDAAAAALPPGLTLVPGAELSCRWFGTDPPIGLHMLAYLFDPGNEPLAAEMSAVRRERVDRAGKIVARLNADGIDVTMDEVERHAGGESVGRPHLARALILRGLVKTMEDAFGPEWLGRRYRVEKADTDVFAALRLVREAGGVAVFAHPRARRFAPIVPDSLIMELAAEGLWGLEADHLDHTADDRAHLRGLARDLRLRVTGSSDYHGAAQSARLGAFTTDPEVYEELIDAAAGAAMT